MADNQRSQESDLRGSHPARRWRALAAFGALALVAACASEPKPVMVGEPNKPPANYRAEILAYLKTYLNDPTGVREAFITEPVLRPIGPGGQRTFERYALCIRFNAKNSIGKYEGSRDRLVVFLDGRLDTMAPARGEQCRDASWMPFPELEKLKR